ncbi:MAG: ABC transporter substrate-binding protein [Clostridia bacterium]|jgi:branched-chain amino acid transport system substrate-binding protein|nr:ABC transporter substrate-binding protein [Clostridia bacterium]
MKKKLFWLIPMVILLAFALVISGCGQKSSPPVVEKVEQPKETLRIGAIYSITGPGASLGIPERDTVVMLEEQINAAGGINGHPIEVIIYDDETDGTKGMLAAKKLVEEHKVNVVIGPTTSGVSLALKPYFTEMEIPLVSAAAAAKIVEPVNESFWIFKTAQSDYLVFEVIIDYLKKHNMKKVGFISEASGYGDSGRLELEKLAPAAGIEVVAWERFDRADRDMTAQLTKIRRANPDAIIVWSIPPAASVVQQNIFDMGIKIPIIQSHGIGNQTFIDVAGQAAEGVIFPAGKLLIANDLPDAEPQKKTIVKFRDEYTKKYGVNPSTFAGHAWDGMMLVVAALETGARTPQEIRDYLENKKNFVGITGMFNFSAQDHNGLDQSALAWIEIKDGKWIKHER